MIPILRKHVCLIIALGASPTMADAPATVPPPAKTQQAVCLASGDGYLRAKIEGAIDTRLDWPNSGTRCEGESRETLPGVRLSFHRDAATPPDLLMVFGLTAISEGQSGREIKVNLTVIQQGTSHIYGTLGDTRCMADTVSQQPTAVAHTYRLEVRGFCTQPAHAVRGKGDILVSTFEFAGPVSFEQVKD